MDAELRRVLGRSVELEDVRVEQLPGEDAAVPGFRVTRRVSEPATEWHSLPGLLTKSDFVILHVPLTGSTLHMFDAETLAAMRRGTVLINCTWEFGSLGPGTAGCA